MKIVTVGMFSPPNVPILPLVVTDAATYPARNAAWSVANVRPRTFGIVGS